MDTSEFTRQLLSANDGAKISLGSSQSIKYDNRKPETPVDGIFELVKKAVGQEQNTNNEIVITDAKKDKDAVEVPSTQTTATKSTRKSKAKKKA